MEIVIKPQKTLTIDWRELWGYRELFYFFIWRDIKVRYKQTAIGAAWAIIQPFLTMVVFTVFFGKLVGIKPQGDIPYAIFVYSGLLFWHFFSQGLGRTSESVVANQGVVTKVYFPRIIVPLAASLAGIVDFFFALLVFIALLFFFQIVPTLLGILLFLPMLLVSLVAMAGLGMIFAAVNVKYRDVRHALPFVIQLMLFLTPVIYPVSLVPERFQWLLYLNPMTGVISTMRSLILHDPAPPTSLVALSIGVAVAFFVVGLIYFRKREREFADIV